MNYLRKEIDEDEIVRFGMELEDLLIHGTEEEKEAAAHSLHLAQADEYFILEQLWDRKATDEEKQNRAAFEAAVNSIYA